MDEEVSRRKREHAKNDAGEGRSPLKRLNDENIQLVDKFVSSNRRITVQTIIEDVDIVHRLTVFCV